MLRRKYLSAASRLGVTSGSNSWRVELPFGDDKGAFPPWDLDLGDGHHLLLSGRIDRIDIFKEAEADHALCVVVDYKSSHKQLDSLLMEHGLQLQLAAYLNVLCHWPGPQPMFGVSRLIPAAMERKSFPTLTVLSDESALA